jgi:hypothetical protein
MGGSGPVTQAQGEGGLLFPFSIPPLQSHVLSPSLGSFLRSALSHRRGWSPEHPAAGGSSLRAQPPWGSMAGSWGRVTWASAVRTYIVCWRFDPHRVAGGLQGGYGPHFVEKEAGLLSLSHSALCSSQEFWETGAVTPGWGSQVQLGAQDLALGSRFNLCYLSDFSGTQCMLWKICVMLGCHEDEMR